MGRSWVIVQAASQSCRACIMILVGSGCRTSREWQLVRVELPRAKAGSYHLKHPIRILLVVTFGDESTIVQDLIAGDIDLWWS